MALDDDGLKAAWNSLLTFLAEFRDESDRAAVILGAAKLDTLLYQILDRHFLPCLSSYDELLDGDAPLSTFSSKINICYRLGLISSDFAKALHGIRKIRNSFAHEMSGASLASGPQADRLYSLLLPFRSLPRFKQMRGTVFGDEVSPSIDFKTYLALIAARLEGALARTKPLSGADAVNLISQADMSNDEGDKAVSPEASGAPRADAAAK
jgi:uncharacterized protein YlaN (UPF0358 family)